MKLDNRLQYAKNREYRKAQQRNWNVQNAERAAQYARDYRVASPSAAREWRQANKQLAALYTTTRRAAKMKRTPKWTDVKAIELVYLNCPTGMEVDHVIPLRGKFVSGLHVPNNLQYLTKRDNCAKRNKFDPADYYTTRTRHD